MSKTFTIFLLSFFTCCVIFLSSCNNNNPVDPVVTTFDVNGKVVDLGGRGIAGVTAIINNKTAYSIYDGSFTIKDVSKPYDLQLIRLNGTFNIGSVYPGLNTATPNAFLPLSSDDLNASTVTVHIPALSYFQKAIVVFTDGQYIEAGYPLSAKNTTASFSVSWPSNISSITGKIIVLICTVNGGNVTYDNYGEKANIVLTRGGLFTATFTNVDLALNPGETTVSGTVTAPSGYHGINSQSQISFKTQGSIFYNSYELGISSSIDFNYTVPTGLPSPFRFSVIGFADGNEDQILSNNALEVLPGTSGNVLTLQQSNNLISPGPDATMIDSTSTFTFSSGTGSGINGVSFETDLSRITIFTTSSSVKLPNLSYYGLGISPGSKYIWTVQKFNGINSTDDFVSKGLLNNSNWNGLGRTYTRSFTTKPE